MNLIGLFTAELKATAQAEEVKERQFVILLLVIWLGIVKIILLGLNTTGIIFTGRRKEMKERTESKLLPASEEEPAVFPYPQGVPPC